MFTKPVRLIGLGIALILVGILAGIQGVMPARAASPAQTSTPACNTCHEDQYYLHDAGKWYCITEAKERCVNCHGGNPEALTEEEAHVGMVANPFSDGLERCKTCHAQDAETLAQEVIARTGYHSVIKTDPYVVNVSASEAVPAALESGSDSQGWLWLVPVAVVVFMFWLFLVLRAGRM